MPHRCSCSQGNETACPGSAPVHRRSAAGRWTSRSAAWLECPTLETRPRSGCPRSCKHTCSISTHCLLYIIPARVYFIFFVPCKAEKETLGESNEKGGRITKMSLMVWFMLLGVRCMHIELNNSGILILLPHMFASCAELIHHPVSEPNLSCNFLLPLLTLHLLNNPCLLLLTDSSVTL